MRLLNNFQRGRERERERGISKNFDFPQFAIFGFLFTDRTSRFEVKRDEMGVEDGYCTARFVSSISSFDAFPLRRREEKFSFGRGEEEEQAMMSRKKYRRDASKG